MNQLQFFLKLHQLSESRIWIFSSSIKISEDSQKDISERIIKFLNSWKHHGVDLPCSFKILDAFFIIIALDQSNNSAGGCSIDQMFNCISDIDQQFDLSLLDRSKMHFFIDNQVLCYPLEKVDVKFSDYLFFDQTIDKKKQLDDWLILLKNSWFKRFLR